MRQSGNPSVNAARKSFADGGNATGATMKNLDLGTLGNTIAAAIGGASGGTLLTARNFGLKGSHVRLELPSLDGKAAH